MAASPRLLSLLPVACVVNDLALFNHIRVYLNIRQASVLHCSISLHISFRPRLYYPARRPSTVAHTSGGISDYLYAGNSTKHDTRSTPAGSRASITCGKGVLQALALPPARQASTPVIRSTASPRHLPRGPRRQVEIINLHAPPCYFSLTFALQFRRTPHSFPQSFLK